MTALDRLSASVPFKSAPVRERTGRSPFLGCGLYIDDALIVLLKEGLPVERLVVVLVLLTVLSHLVLVALEKTRGVRLLQGRHNGFRLLTTCLVVRPNISFTVDLGVLGKSWGF